MKEYVLEYLSSEGKWITLNSSRSEHRRLALSALAGFNHGDFRLLEINEKVIGTIKMETP